MATLRFGRVLARLFLVMNLLVPLSVSALETSLSGNLDTGLDWSLPWNQTDNSQLNGVVRADGKVTASTDQARFVMAGWAQIDQSGRLLGSIDSAGIRVAPFSGNLSLWAGKQRMLIGIGDFRSPVDHINPLDERLGFVGLMSEWDIDSDNNLSAAYSVDRVLSDPSHEWWKQATAVVDYRGRIGIAQYEATLIKAAGNSWDLGAGLSLDLGGLIWSLEAAWEFQQNYWRPVLDAGSLTASWQEWQSAQGWFSGQTALRYTISLDHFSATLGIFANANSASLLIQDKIAWQLALANGLPEGALPALSPWYLGGSLNLEIWDALNLAVQAIVNPQDASSHFEIQGSWMTEAGWGIFTEMQFNPSTTRLTEFGLSDNPFTGRFGLRINI